MLQQLELEGEPKAWQAEVAGVECHHRRAADMRTDDVRDGGDGRAVYGLVGHAESIAAAAALARRKSRRMSEHRWLRQRLTTFWRKESELTSLVQAVEKGAVLLRGRPSAGSSSKQIRVGIGTPSPTAMASAFRSDGSSSSRPMPDSGIAARRNSWSFWLLIRSAKMVLHWESTVEASSDGRWLTRQSETPYLRPSLAMRESARLVGSKMVLSSAGA